MRFAIEANIPEQGCVHVEIEGAVIASVCRTGPMDPEKPFISPGFVDLQLNGFAGIDFSDPQLDVQKATSILPSVWKTGVTTFCPTLITNSHTGLLRNLAVLEEARRSDIHFARAVPHYHLEGPYLSPLGARGAHNENLMRPPDWSEFERLQAAAGRRIGIVSLAPELPGAIEFIRLAQANGIIVALAHTDATPEQVHMAAEAGAVLSTHLGNGSAEYIHRHRAPFWAQLAIDTLKATIICDGFHLPPELVKIIARVKGAGGTILVTDAVYVAGLSPSQYSLGGSGTDIELLPSGQVVTSDRRCMAGSALTMNRAVTTYMKFAEVTLRNALQAATINPAKVLGCSGLSADIAVGMPADCTVFRCGPESLDVQTVISSGEIVYAAGERETVRRRPDV